MNHQDFVLLARNFPEAFTGRHVKWLRAGLGFILVVSPWDENIRILVFMFGLLRDVNFRFPVGKQSAALGP
jgi:hypothetical protein